HVVIVEANGGDDTQATERNIVLNEETRLDGFRVGEIFRRGLERADLVGDDAGREVLFCPIARTRAFRVVGNSAIGEAMRGAEEIPRRVELKIDRPHVLQEAEIRDAQEIRATRAAKLVSVFPAIKRGVAKLDFRTVHKEE